MRKELFLFLCDEWKKVKQRASGLPKVTQLVKDTAGIPAVAQGLSAKVTQSTQKDPVM